MFMITVVKTSGPTCLVIVLSVVGFTEFSPQNTLAVKTVDGIINEM
jgi:hypothetical protein